MISFRKLNDTVEAREAFNKGNFCFGNYKNCVNVNYAWFKYSMI